MNPSPTPRHTPSGYEYEVVRPGQNATHTEGLRDRVHVRYCVKTHADGRDRVIEENFSANGPAVFTLDNTNPVLAEVLMIVPQSAFYRFKLPARAVLSDAARYKLQPDDLVTFEVQIEGIDRAPLRR